VFDDNSAFVNGGAVALFQSKLDLVDCMFQNNRALNNGNDIYNIKDDIDPFTGRGSFVN